MQDGVKMIMQFTAEQIEANFNAYRRYCSTTGERSTNVLKLVDALGERLALAPASARTSYHLAVPGGLVDHSLRVLKNAVKLCKACDWLLPNESLIIAALFHDVGKCSHLMPDGTFIDHYIPQDSQWHRDKCGEMYKYNDDIPYMTVPHRSLWLLQQFNVMLTYDEWIAIMLHDGFILQENKSYCMRESILAHVIMTADYSATLKEKTFAREGE